MAGNKNSGRRSDERPFQDALFMEIKKAGNEHKQLRRIAQKLLNKAEEGDMQAINAVADRLDGKPKQQIEGDIKGGLTIVISDKDADTA